MTISDFQWPRAFPRSTDYCIQINGEDRELLHSSVGSFIILDGDETIDVKVQAIKTPGPIKDAVVKPLRLGITTEINERNLRFKIDGPADIVVVMPGLPDLFIFYGKPETDKPDANDPNVTVFKAGQIHEVDHYEIGENQTIYIEGGAVVRGALHLIKANNCVVRGRGIIDNSYFARSRGMTRNAYFAEFSDNIELRDVTFVESNTWTVKPAACKNVLIDGIRILADLIAADGIDIVSCQDSLVQNCFVRSGDDCFCVKSVEYGRPDKRWDLCKDVANNHFKDCTAYSFSGGSALELGHEFRCESVKNISFKNIDIIAVHGYGAAFSISQCDSALIEDVLYEDIRVEHHYHELISFRIVNSSYAVHEERGRVKNVTLRNIDIATEACNYGYSNSLIGGWDDEHDIDGVHFENITYGGVNVTSADDIDLFSRYAKNITFA